VPLLAPYVRPLWQGFIDGDTTDAVS